MEPRPPSVSFYSVARDTVARLPDGKGNIDVFLNLLHDSQYILKKKPRGELLGASLYCCQNLSVEEDPSLSIDSTTGIMTYLHNNWTAQQHSKF